MDSQLDPDALGLGTAPEDLAQGQSDATLLKQVSAASNTALLGGVIQVLTQDFLPAGYD